MSSEFETRLTAALHDQVESITTASLQHPVVARRAAARPTSRFAAPLGAAAAVSALAVGAWVGFSPPGPAVVEQAAAGSAVVITADQVNVDGLVVPIPQAWTAHDLGRNYSNTGVNICLVPAESGSVDVRTETADCGGILVTVADVDAAGRSQLLPTHVPDCADGASNNVTLDNAASIGGRAAWLFEQRCGDDSRAAELWQLTDLSFNLRTPTGHFQTEVRALAEEINFFAWPHPNNAAAANPPQPSLTEGK